MNVNNLYSVIYKTIFLVIAMLIALLVIGDFTALNVFSTMAGTYVAILIQFAITKKPALEDDDVDVVDEFTSESLALFDHNATMLTYVLVKNMLRNNHDELVKIGLAVKVNEIFDSLYDAVNTSIEEVTEDEYMDIMERASMAKQSFAKILVASKDISFSTLIECNPEVLGSMPVDVVEAISKKAQRNISLVCMDREETIQTVIQEYIKENQAEMDKAENASK